MGSKMWLIVFVLAMASAVSVTDAFTGAFTFPVFGWQFGATPGCGTPGSCSPLKNPTSERKLRGGRRRYISYGALRANNIPCGRRGASYYGCNRRLQSNPYNRGCTRITQCYRYTN